LLSADPISFRLAQRSQDPTSTLAIGDLNHDGIPDMVAVAPGHNAARIWLGRGDGTFSPFLAIRVFDPRSVTIADFNGDGNADFAVTSPQGDKDSSVDLLYGRGDGTFFGPVHYSTHVDAITVTSADFNGDGLPDLALSNRNRVSVMLNEGNQVFAPPAFYVAGGELSRYIATGDFNNDGAPDLVVVRSNSTVNVLLNQTINGVGTGLFGAPISAPVGIDPQIVVTGDFNGDGKLDVAVVNSNFRVAPVSVLLGNGDGTFQPRRNYFGGNFVDGLAVGDFNGDGKLDLASTSFTSAMRVYPGNGDGTFQPQTDVTAGQQGIFLKSADLNADGLPDIILASGGGFRALLNTSTSTAPVGTPGMLNVSFGGGNPNSVRFLNSQGVMTTVSLAGPGAGAMSLTGTDLTQTGNLITGENIAIDSITTSGTTRASSLTLSTNRKSGVIGVNTILVGGPLKALNAQQVILHGDCTINGPVQSVGFDSVIDGSLNIVGSAPAPGSKSTAQLTLKVTRADGMTVNAGMPIKLIDVGQWISSDGTHVGLTAGAVNTIRSDGPFAADLGLSGSLGTFSGAQITGGAWLVQGNIGKISAKSLVNTYISATGSINTISVSRNSRAFTFGNVFIFAGNIGSANLGTISFNNSGSPFGVSVTQSSGLLSGQDAVTGKTFVVRDLSPVISISDVLAARGIAAQDFYVHFGVIPI
jgi:hypothetical protein